MLNTLIILIITLWAIIHFFSEDGFFMSLLMGLSFFILSIFISFLLSLIVTSFAEVEYYKKSSENIVALKDNYENNQYFISNKYNNNSNMQYVFMIRNEDGNKMKTIDIKNVYIVEDNNTTPKVEYYYGRFKNTYTNLMFTPVASVQTKIIIPENSIKYDYEIDME